MSRLHQPAFTKYLKSEDPRPRMETLHGYNEYMLESVKDLRSILYELKKYDDKQEEVPLKIQLAKVLDCLSTYIESFDQEDARAAMLGCRQASRKWREIAKHEHTYKGDDIAIARNARNRNILEVTLDGMETNPPMELLTRFLGLKSKNINERKSTVQEDEFRAFLDKVMKGKPNSAIRKTAVDEFLAKREAAWQGYLTGEMVGLQEEQAEAFSVAVESVTPTKARNRSIPA